MLHKEFWGLLLLGVVFWVFIAATPSVRIENGCRPVAWTGNVITSMSAMVLPAQQQKVQGWFDKLEYGCRYTAWRLFYQDAYNQWKNSTAVTAPAIAPLIAPAAAAAAPTASAPTGSLPVAVPPVAPVAPVAPAPAQAASTPVAPL